MSKYIIEIKPEYEDKFKGVMILGAENSNLYVDSNTVDELEELTSDYINEHFGELQDEAYQKGLEEGREQKPCDTCAYRHNNLLCADCKWTYGSRYKADKIEVGDEVNWLGTCFIVTRIFQPHNMKEQCDGIDDDGCVYQYVLMDDLEKTGRHFDIASILKEMQS